MHRAAVPLSALFLAAVLPWLEGLICVAARAPQKLWGKNKPPAALDAAISEASLPFTPLPLSFLRWTMTPHLSSCPHPAFLHHPGAAPPANAGNNIHERLFCRVGCVRSGGVYVRLGVIRNGRCSMNLTGCVAQASRHVPHAVSFEGTKLVVVCCPPATLPAAPLPAFDF